MHVYMPTYRIGMSVWFSVVVVICLSFWLVGSFAVSVGTFCCLTPPPPPPPNGNAKSEYNTMTCGGRGRGNFNDTSLGCELLNGKHNYSLNVQTPLII